MEWPPGRGFTLVELMVTIAVMAILAMVAVPNFIEFKRNSDLVSATNGLLAAINAAKSEAMKRSVNAGAAPLTGTNWNTGIRVFIDNDLTGTFTTGDTELTRFVTTVDSADKSFAGELKVSSSASALSYIGFNAAGFLQRVPAAAATGTTLSIERTDSAAADKGVSTTTRRVVIGPSGRVRTCRPASDSDANCLVSAS